MEGENQTGEKTISLKIYLLLLSNPFQIFTLYFLLILESFECTKLFNPLLKGGDFKIYNEFDNVIIAVHKFLYSKFFL